MIYWHSTLRPVSSHCSINYPNFEQGSTIIAAFGEATAEAVEEAGLRLDIKAPTEKAPSMTMALEQFIKAYNKENKSK